MMMTAGIWQALIIFVSVAGLMYLWHKNVNDIKYELFFAAAISALWVWLVGWYSYEQSNYVLIGLNLFTFTAWTAGLVFAKEIYEWLPRKTRFATATALWIAAIITFEWIGYNVWMIQLNAGYPGLLGMPLMHMPWYGQAYYLLAGPAFFVAMDKLKVR